MPDTALGNRIMSQNILSLPVELQLKVIKMPEIKDPFSISFCNYFTYSHMKAGIENILELSFSFKKFYKKQTSFGFKDTNKVYMSHLFIPSALTECLLYARKLAGCW